MRAQWLKEKELIAEITQAREQVEELRLELERARRVADFEKAARLQYGEIPAAEKQIEERQAELAQIQSKESYLKEEVTDEDIARVVSQVDRHPGQQDARGRARQAAQDGGAARRARDRPARRRASRCPTPCAARAPASARSRARSARSCSSARPASARPSWPRRWPSSCSTTSKAMIRLDMSEYMEKHAVARLIGAPPGYVGYEEGGQLTEPVRRRPYSVILFDEIEKAHPDVWNVLLQVLDDGRLTDGQGRTVDFKNTVIILTSNIGSQHLLGAANEKEMREAVHGRAAQGIPTGVPEPARRDGDLPSPRPRAGAPHRRRAAGPLRGAAAASASSCWRSATRPRTSSATSASTHRSARARSSAPSSSTWRTRWPRRSWPATTLPGDVITVELDKGELSFAKQTGASGEQPGRPNAPGGRA